MLFASFCQVYMYVVYLAIFVIFIVMGPTTHCCHLLYVVHPYNLSIFSVQLIFWFLCFIVTANYMIIHSSVALLRPIFSIILSYTSHNSLHYTDVIMDEIASQITSLTIVYSTVYSDADQRKHQSSASLAFVRGIHRFSWQGNYWRFD